MQLNAKSLDAARFAADNPERGHLSGLHISPTHVVATDSFQLLEVSHPPKQEDMKLEGIRSDEQTGTIPAEAAIHASKNIPKGDTLFALKTAFSSVDAEGKRMTLTTTDLMQERSVEANLIEGSYPDYRSVFPTDLPVGTVSLDARLLKNMADYFAKHADGRRITIDFYGEGKPVVFRGETDVTIQQVRGLIMPLKPSDKDNG